MQMIVIFLAIFSLFDPADNIRGGLPFYNFIFRPRVVLEVWFVTKIFFSCVFLRIKIGLKMKLVTEKKNPSVQEAENTPSAFVLIAFELNL